MKKNVDSKVLITGLVVLGIIIVVFAIIGFFESASGYNTITSYGDGSVEALPDFIAVYFNVQTTGSTADEASDKNSDIMQNMRYALIALGFSEDEIKTEGFSVYPNYDWNSGTQKITGYSASHSVSVKLSLEDKDNVGNVIDAGIGAGAGINYIGYEFTKENENAYKAEAIRSATEDARVKAAALAEGAGKKLGDIVSLSTSDSYYGPWVAYSAEGRDSSSSAEIATSINPSEQEISARVTGVWEIR